MDAIKVTPKTSSFRLSMAILNLDVSSPVLFLHILVDPVSKNITGTCELSKQRTPSPLPFKTELSGEYEPVNTQEGKQLMLNLLGFPLYDQICPTIKISLLTDINWKESKAHYEYLDDDKWLKISTVYLKIKHDSNVIHTPSLKVYDQPQPFPASSLDIPQGAYAARPIAWPLLAFA